MASNNLRTLETLFTESIGDNNLKKIIIPKIQRSYAQGRKEEVQVREGILQELFTTLKEGRDIELNFIYGSLKENGNYELLDGQQRITTLFLLHLYVYLQEKGALPSWFKNCLTYETRNSSRDFIEELCELDKLTGEEYMLPSDYIKNQKWYSNAFHLDPSIEAMLIMLDTIDKYYKEIGISIADKLEHIRFYALNLNDFNLTEELYIKMNARGLPLTPFENFKADLVGYYKPAKDAPEEEFKSWLDFATKLDTEWIDIFWNKKSSDREVDNQYFRFFYRVATLLTVIFGQKDTTADKMSANSEFDFFRQKSESQTDDKARYLGFKDYSILFEALGKNKSREILSLLLDTFKSYPTIFEEAKAAWGEQITPFADLKNYSQKNAVVFAGIVLYVLTQETLSKENIDFKHWMRVVWNIVENTDINGVVPQVGTIRALYDLISNSKGNIYTYLAQQEKGVTNAIDEEIRKAKLIVADNSFETILVEQEKHPFFKGFAGVVLSEGITPSQLKNRIEKIADLFDENGISPQYRDGQHLLIRTCIASFCKNPYELIELFVTEKITADAHLKALLRREWVAKMLQEALDSQNDIVKALNNIIAQATLPDNTDSSMRKAFYRLIKEPKLYDWIAERTSSAKVVKIKRGDNNEVYLHFPRTWYDYLYLDNERHIFIPLAIENGFHFIDRDSNEGYWQKLCFEQSGNYYGYWDIKLGKTINSRYTILLSFDRFNCLTISIQGLDITKDYSNLFDQPNPEDKTIVKILNLETDEATILSVMEEIERKVSAL
ncbi:DUF262 domain-containing protein [Capnocytophaga gingivalis]